MAVPRNENKHRNVGWGKGDIKCIFSRASTIYRDVRERRLRFSEKFRLIFAAWTISLHTETRPDHASLQNGSLRLLTLFMHR
jgi:hypothetical protein